MPRKCWYTALAGGSELDAEDRQVRRCVGVVVLLAAVASAAGCNARGAASNAGHSPGPDAKTPSATVRDRVLLDKSGTGSGSMPLRGPGHGFTLRATCSGGGWGEVQA